MSPEVSLKFTRRAAGRRPPLDLEIVRTDRSVWPRFAPFHYMSADLVKSCRCFLCLSDGEPVAFCAVIFFPHIQRPHFRIHRLVTAPDWQGLGIGMCVLEKIAGAYAALGHEMRMPAIHPGLVRQLDRSRQWRLLKRPGLFTGRNRNSVAAAERGTRTGAGNMGGRPCAVFRYVGPALPTDDARALLGKEAA